MSWSKTSALSAGLLVSVLANSGCATTTILLYPQEEVVTTERLQHEVQLSSDREGTSFHDSKTGQELKSPHATHYERRSLRRETPWHAWLVGYTLAAAASVSLIAFADARPGLRSLEDLALTAEMLDSLQGLLLIRALGGGASQEAVSRQTVPKTITIDARSAGKEQRRQVRVPETQSVSFFFGTPTEFASALALSKADATRRRSAGQIAELLAELSKLEKLARQTRDPARLDVVIAGYSELLAEQGLDSATRAIIKRKLDELRVIRASAGGTP